MNIWKNRDWKPMLLEEVNKAFNSNEYLFELKFDGFRAIIFASPNKVTIQSRNLNDITYLYPELQSIKNIVKKDVIFDGEIIALENGLPSFAKLQKRSRLKNNDKINYMANNDPVTFIAFDILYEEKELTNLSLLKRKNYLNKYPDIFVFTKSKAIENNGIKLFNLVKKKGLEGIVAKKKNSHYHINERTNDFIKIKNIQRDEFIIGGYIKKENTLSLLLGELKKNKLIFVGKVSIGKRKALAKEILAMKKVKNSFANYDEEAFFISPKLTCFVGYLERTKNNHLRHPVLQDFN